MIGLHCCARLSNADDVRRCMRQSRTVCLIRFSASLLRRNVVVLKELANGVGAVYLEPVIIAAEFLQQTEIMKRRADEQQLSIERLSCLPPQLIGPEEDTMRVVEEQ